VQPGKYTPPHLRVHLAATTETSQQGPHSQNCLKPFVMTNGIVLNHSSLGTRNFCLFDHGNNPSRAHTHTHIHTHRHTHTHTHTHTPAKGTLVGAQRSLSHAGSSSPKDWMAVVAVLPPVRVCMRVCVCVFVTEG